MKKILQIVSVITLSLVVIGCVTNLASYNSRSPEEEEIKNALISWQDAWNSADQVGYLSFIHDDAKWMSRGVKNLSKETYARDYLPGNIKSIKYNLGSPKIDVQGNEASVNVPLRTPKKTLYLKQKWIKENGKWFIIEAEY